MARPHGYKRLTRKARHLIRHLRRTRHASVQDQMVHELRHEVSRTHGFHGPKKAPDRSPAGRWRPLTHRAKQLLTRLRKAKVWGVQKQLVNELEEEIQRGRRLERAKAAARSAAARARQAAGRFRGAVRQGQERLLTRAERRQSEREAGKRKPALSTRARRGIRERTAALRGKVGVGLRSRFRRRQRVAPGDLGWERSRYNPQSPRYRPLAERPRNRGRGPRPVPARRRTPRTPRPRPVRTR